jgi:hypothetical protein
MVNEGTGGGQRWTVEALGILSFGFGGSSLGCIEHPDSRCCMVWEIPQCTWMLAEA